MIPILLHLLLLRPLGADVPKVTLSPDTVAVAEAVETSIDTVVLYGDRAVVHRSGKMNVAKGTTTLTLPNLPNTIDPNSLRLKVPNATLLRMEKRLVNTEEYPIKEIQGIIEKLETLDVAIQKLQLQRSLFQAEITRLQQLTPASLSGDDYTNNIAQYNLQIWRQNWRFIRSQMERAQSELFTIDQQLKEERKKFMELQRKAQPYLQGSLSKSSYEVVAVIDSNAGRTVKFNLEYTINGARWTPTYDVHYDSETDTARIEAAALVVQSSGENWEGVELEFATSNRQHYRSLPTMLTWTLGERNEYIPMARAANSRTQQPLYPPFSSQVSKSELDTVANREQYASEKSHLTQLTARLNNILPQSTEQSGVYSLGRVDSSIVQGVSGGAYGNTAYGALGYAEAPPAQREYEEEMAPQYMFAEDMMDSATVESVQSRSIATLSGMSQRSKRPEMAKAAKVSTGSLANIPLALEASNLYAPIRVHNDRFNIPTQDSLNLKWNSIGQFDVPSDGQQHRIPLESTEHKTISFYEATPSLEERAYLKGTVTNTNEQAILQGNASIFLNGHFTVQSTLATTKAGGLLELPLGADESIRIKRNITPMQRKEGLLKQQDITDYTVKIEVGNYKKRPIAIRILDQLPITQNDAITIESLTASHPYKQEKNNQGILHWDLEIPAGQTETIELTYSITRPSGWKLWGN